MRPRQLLSVVTRARLRAVGAAIVSALALTVLIAQPSWAVAESGVTDFGSMKVASCVAENYGYYNNYNEVAAEVTANAYCRSVNVQLTYDARVYNGWAAYTMSPVSNYTDAWEDTGYCTYSSCVWDHARYGAISTDGDGIGVTCYSAGTCS
jgi:hypothetical protein